MDPRAVAILGRAIVDQGPAIARAVWRFAAQDKVIGVWTILLAAVIVARAGRGVVVTLGGLLVIVTPAYAALFWLIHERQAGRDAADEATSTSRAAARRTKALEEYFDDATPSTGRHGRR